MIECSVSNKQGKQQVLCRMTFLHLTLRSAAGGIICVLWFGARLVVEDRLSPGELSTFVIYAVYVGSNVGVLAGVVSSLVQVYCNSLSMSRRSLCMLCTRVHPLTHQALCLQCTDLHSWMLLPAGLCQSWSHTQTEHSLGRCTGKGMSPKPTI